VGTGLMIKLSYHGDAAKDDIFTCDVTVEHQDGWTSLGSEFLFADYQSQQDMAFYDRYRRGVSVTFAAMGEVRQFDYVTLMNVIIQGLVLFGMVETVTRVLAHNLLPESPQYMKASNDQFHHKKALATFGVNVALACQAFKTWDTGCSGSITEEELKAVFLNCFDEELSKTFVKLIMDLARERGTENVDGASCEDLVHIISSGIVSIGEVQKLAGGGRGRGRGRGIEPKDSETKVTPVENA